MSNDWTGEERRMNPHECTQGDNIRHLQSDIENHKAWRKDTTELLQNINVAVATLNERLKAKLDDDTKRDADVGMLKNTIISTVAGLLISVFCAVYAYGGMAKQVDINTARWDKLLGTEDHKEIR